MPLVNPFYLYLVDSMLSLVQGGVGRVPGVRCAEDGMWGSEQKGGLIRTLIHSEVKNHKLQSKDGQGTGIGNDRKHGSYFLRSLVP